MTMSVDMCLPERLRTPATVITPISAGLSGAGVYRVDAEGESFVLKVSGDGPSHDEWRRSVVIQRGAAAAGVAPRIVHVDEGRRAVVSAFVANRPFPAFYRSPATHAAAVMQLGKTLRTVHALPLPPDGITRSPKEFLAEIWSTLHPNFAVPAFVGNAVMRVLSGDEPARDRPFVLSHNDVNPSNLIYDGERIFLVDWDSAGPNDPLYDLAVLSVFLGMDDATCLNLLSAYDGAPAEAIPAAFTYNRHLAATLAGTMFLNLARRNGHPGAVGTETRETCASLGECYRLMQSGTLSIAASDGQWTFGLALVKEGGLQ